MNKKGQVTSIILVVVTLFIIGIILLFMNKFNEQIYSELEEYLEDSEYNQSEAHQAAEDLQEIEQSRIWDYVFLAVFIGMLIQMLIFSFATKTNIAFFWIFVILGIVILIVGVVISNIWQETVANPAFTETVARFPITDAILGTYFPTVIVAILFLGMIILFGKFPGREDT